ncbi:glycosyl hydrolase family 18 protein [Pseudomonas sp. H3(2019)]|uniref:glycosyl hydrolase family 18 protein n=1 Tax=Pseudomonas sp. H3(2019) TaxID=2598724 RepID=UPI0011974768|nr:glycosyl hydrolase family 18 protein [Pseudomonas sp. H3(2019)]TVT84049.1 chitinase [Pseudomonas sp. H3(2019)]
MTAKEAGLTQVGRAGRDSKLVFQSDPGTVVAGVTLGGGAAEKTYVVNGFSPSTKDDQLSWTPGRVTKNVFNQYEKNEFECFCYYSDWGIGDPRYEGTAPQATGGRGTDVMRLLGKTGTFDKIVLGFAAIVGDLGVNRNVIARAAHYWDHEPVPGVPPTQAQLDAAEKLWMSKAALTDPWGDVAAYINCGYSSYIGENYKELFDPAKAQGLLGALGKLKTANPDMQVSLSLGGWSMSEAFFDLVRDPDRLPILVDSIVAIFEKFPMFTGIDIDWEYPGAPGNAPGDGDTWKPNKYDDNDAAYFAVLIRAVKAKLPNVEISIASIADPVKLAKSHILLLIAAGVDIVNLMCYDFFGTPWATTLQHHCNLYRSNPADITENSVHSAVQYLLGLGVDSKKICLGYAGYSRNAQQAKLESVSPLKGTYAPRNGTDTGGSFESGVTEWPDMIYNYLDLETKQPLNGFILYTDDKADADFLYNPTTELFISFDTPRTIKAKGEYVKKWNLGGLFSWMGDYDNGMLNNAACEGVGRTLKTEAIDMSPFYYKGATELPPPPRR